MSSYFASFQKTLRSPVCIVYVIILQFPVGWRDQDGLDVGLDEGGEHGVEGGGGAADLLVNPRLYRHLKRNGLYEFSG